MSFADYSQRAEDHQTLLVLVQSIGSQVKSKTYQKLFDRISRLQSVAVPGQQRNIKLRYKKLYPAENNEWGDFQVQLIKKSVMNINSVLFKVYFQQ